MDEDDYRPIDCELYSEYELAIMHRRLLRVHWREAGQDHIAMLRLLDLRTESSKEEFLLAEQMDGTSVKLRLDRILHVTPIHQETSYRSG